jgi:asparagine synthase (glutamine-hydrolysing)
MCGIAGAMDVTGTRSFTSERLRAMCASLAHRGPDDEHHHFEAGIALGARRLAIVDLQGGRQPLCNERQNIWVAFNGELFEYPELFAELQAKGHTFSTHCDTEIWPHLYEEHGVALFERARGQFAVSLWDADKRTLLLGRDRVGICPLYYAESDGWLLWASEIKALFASGLVSPRPDRRGLDDFFCFYSAGTTRTFFDGVRSLPPGHYLQVREGRVALHKYWDLDFPDRGEETRAADETTLIDELEHLLRQSVRRRLRGDVPVGSYLSGGVDSSTVLALAVQESRHPVRSFTIGLRAGAGADEHAQAEETAERLGSPLTPILMNRRDIADAFPRLIQASEGPVVDTSCACMIRLAENVHRQGYKVVLTGEGADEALAGYGWFKMQKLHQATGWLVPRLRYALGRGGLHVLGGKYPRQRTPFRALRGVRTAQQGIFEYIGRSRETLYSAEMWSSLENHSPFDDLDLTNERMPRWHPLNQAIYVDYRTFLPGLLLSSKGDRSAMNSSVETRPPFLDEDVIAFCARLHPRYKLRGRTEKWLLRRVADRLLPPHISRRRKHGFHATFSRTFLDDDRPPWVDELLSAESLRRSGYFDPAAVAKTRARLTRRRLMPSFRYDIGMTAVIATQLWHHTFCGGLSTLPTWSPPALEPPRSLKDGAANRS